MDETMECGNAVDCIVKPLRSNGVPYSGINILMHWAAAMDTRALRLPPG